MRDPDEPRVCSPGFHERVFAEVERIPEGKLSTYGDVATRLGSSRVARQVGWALSALPPDRSEVPWHRVLNAQGRISYRGDTARGSEQQRRLEAEGVVFDESGKCNLKAYRHIKSA